MSLEIEGQQALDHPVEANHEPQKKGKILYSRDFLLSLCELDVCKKLPSGFDPSILSEFNVAFNNVQDRQRFPGSFPLQGFRRSEYSSSPPTRGDLNNCSRGIYGRWDNHSCGRGDKDSDFQSNWDADFGRRHGNQSRQSSQNSEHDGLLGSGSFPRPSGYMAGSSAPKVRADEHYKLNRVTEPYHPPRPYKAVPHLRREAKDSYNDETFGSSDCTSQDRAEEERRRRDSFELMRKEQRSLQEKQKLNPGQHKEKLVSDMSFLLEDSKDDKNIVNVDNVLDDCQMEPSPHNGSGRPYCSSQASASRPLIPPGFASTGIERNLGTKLSNPSLQEEVGKHQLQDGQLHVQANPTLDGTSVNQEEKQSAQKTGFSREQLGTMKIHVQLVDNKGEKIVNSSSALEVSNELNKTNNLSCDASDEIIKRSGQKIMSEPGQDQSTTILEKLFSTGLAINNGEPSRLNENLGVKGDELWSPKTAQSSKFAHWFLEDEKKAVDDCSSGRSSDLLSLIVGGDNHGFNVSDVESASQIQPAFPLKSSEHRDNPMTSDASSTVEISEQLYGGNKSEPVSAVLTCEDLEQSILSEISENSTKLHPLIQGLGTLDTKTEQPTAANDDHASQHLLSLLQKGTALQESAPSSSPDMVFSDKLHSLETRNAGMALNNSKQENPEKVNNSGNSLTLETLFGSAFMKELQDSVGSARIDASEPHGLSSLEVDDGLLLHSVDNRSGHGTSVLPEIGRQEHKLGNVEGPWLGFDDCRNETEPVNLRAAVRSKFNGFGTEAEIRLPEEESLFAISDPLNASGLSLMPATNASNVPVGIAEKLAALNATRKDDQSMVRGQEGLPFLRGPYDLLEPHQNLHHQSSANLNPQMNQGKPLFHPFDSHNAHINPHLKFMSPESSIPRSTPPSHQLPGHMLQPPHFQHNSTGLSAFDPRSHQPVLHQMRMPESFPPPDLLPGLSRGSPVPPQLNYHPTGLLQDSNMMHGFPFGRQNPNFRSPGVPLPAPDVGSRNNHPEVLQRLLEMELRSNPKQMNPFPAADHTQGLYGHELETGFRYR